MLNSLGRTCCVTVLPRPIPLDVLAPAVWGLLPAHGACTYEYVVSPIAQYIAQLAHCEID